mgnify:CR=1 FL=1
MDEPQDLDSAGTNGSSETDQTQHPHEQSKSPAAVSNLFQSAVWTSSLWYPYVSFLFCCIATIVTAPFVSAELLPRFASSYIMFCFLLPPIFFVALLLKSRWFRRWSHWFILCWFAMNMFTSMTEGALVSGCLRANTEFQKTLKAKTISLEK